jgi:hypothetical protein
MELKIKFDIQKEWNPYPQHYAMRDMYNWLWEVQQESLEEGRRLQWEFEFTSQDNWMLGISYPDIYKDWPIYVTRKINIEGSSCLFEFKIITKEEYQKFISSD